MIQAVDVMLITKTESGRRYRYEIRSDALLAGGHPVPRPLPDIIHGPGRARGRKSGLLSDHINMNLPGAVRSVDHGCFNVGSFAGPGDKGHTVGQTFFLAFRVPLQQGI